MPVEKLWAKKSSSYGPWQKAFTIAALRRAWLAVRANQGGGGADGETLAQFEAELEANLDRLRGELLGGAYRPRRVTQVLVPKRQKDWRPLALWAVRDRVAQRAVYNYLEPEFECRFLPCSYGFRPGRSVQDAALAVQAAREKGARCVLDADIKDCFGQMQTELVMRMLGRWAVPEPVQHLIEAWLQARVWNAWRGSGQAGSSQGGVITPLLCNLYLHPFDEAMRERGVWLVRYADDFICLTQSERKLQHVYVQAERSLTRLGLQLHPQKTRLTNFDQGFQFLGRFFIRDEMYELR